LPRRTPPSLPDCAHSDRVDPPRIASPLRNVSYALGQPSRNEVSLDASVGADVRRVFWFDGRSFIGVRAVSEGALAWRPTEAGLHLIRVVDDHGRSAERDVDVQFTPWAAPAQTPARRASRYSCYLRPFFGTAVMDVVEKLRGRGRVLDGTEVLATEVPYQLTVWSDAGQTGSNGRLDISFHAGIALMDRAHALLLEV
jgi:hypothetical protein